MRYLILAICLVSSSFALADGLAPGAIAGVWRTASNGYVQIYRQDDHFDGIGVGSLSGKPRFDAHNPDASKRGRRLLGVVVIRHLTYDSGNGYSGGNAYDPDNGKTYKLKGELIDRDTLALRGYVGIPLFGKTQTWHRIQPDTPNVHRDVLHRPLASGRAAD